MKRLTCLIVCLLVVSLTFVFSGNAKVKKNKPKLISHSDTETVITFPVDSYELEGVLTPKGAEVVVNAPHSGRIMKKGAPDLVKLSSSLIIPDKGKMKVDVIDSQFIELENVKVAPSKGNLPRTVDPAQVPYEYGKEYKKNAFFPGNLVEINKPYIARDFRGQAVLIYPFQYNPVTGTLRVYTEITVSVRKDRAKGKNEFDRKKPLKFEELVSEFKQVYSRHFINFDVMRRLEASQASLQYTPLPDPRGRMLIVCYSGFMGNMASFVSHKQSLGYTVDLLDYSALGSSTALKNFVDIYYNLLGLTYLLIVGDHAQVPTSSTSAGDSDNNYGYIVGSDHYLDIFVGRFSAETTAHVDTQVNRTIDYEANVPSTDTWFKNATGMGSSGGPGHHGEYDYQHINYILGDLSSVGYTTYTNHQSGGSTANLTNLINMGQGTLWYAGHGLYDGWYCGWNFKNADVAALTNDNMLPAIFSVACQVGNFRNYTCFCEYWLRETNGSNPTGGIAHAGSTINQSWNPPMDAQDEICDLLVSTTGPNRTFGGIFVNGLFKMIDLNGPAGESMADTWTCFGDSSVQLRTPANPAGPFYCYSAGSSQSLEYIAQVTVGAMTNSSGPSPYSDFTATKVAYLNKGGVVSVSLTPGYPLGYIFTEYWRIWIDYNHDGDFTDSGELVFSSFGTNTINLVFIVPSSAYTGRTRMRVSMKWGGYPSSCELFTWGEVEDYSVDIK